MRKKILVTVIAVVLAMQAAGCGKGQEETAEKPLETSESEDTEIQDEEKAEEVLPEETAEESQEEELPEEIGVQFVSWEDAGLEDHVMDWKGEILERKMQNITGKEEIMLSDVWELTSLNLPGSADGSDWTISDISALSELKNLTELSLYQNSVSDISALSGLKNLTKLYLHTNAISDISALSELKNLTILTLSGNNIHDISALSGLKNLVVLDVRASDLDADIEEKLEELGYSVNHNAISDFSVVLELPNLQHIMWEGNPVEDMSPLETAR